MRQHAEIHTQQEKFKCNACKTKFDTKNELHEHALFHSQDRNIGGECGTTSKDVKELENHVENHKKTNSYSCETCDSKFADREKLYSHMKSHETQGYFNCNKCARSIDRHNDLKTHTENHSIKAMYKCQKCENEFNDQEVLNTHVDTHIVCKDTFMLSNMSFCSCSRVTFRARLLCVYL